MIDTEDQLDPRLESAIKELKAIPPRDGRSGARGRARFLAEARDAPLRTGWATLFSRRISSAMAAAAFLVVVLVGGSGVAVYASQDSLPETPLYPIKLLTENAQIVLAFDPEAKLNLYLSFADRRMSEIAVLGSRNISPPDTVASHLEQDLDQAFEIARGMPDAKKLQTLERMQMRLQRQSDRATEIQSPAADRGQGVKIRVNKALEERLQKLEQEKKGPGDKGPKDDSKQTDSTSTVEDPGQKPAVPPGQEKKQSPASDDQQDDKTKGNGKH